MFYTFEIILLLSFTLLLSCQENSSDVAKKIKTTQASVDLADNTGQMKDDSSDISIQEVEINIITHEDSIASLSFAEGRVKIIFDDFSCLKYPKSTCFGGDFQLIIDNESEFTRSTERAYLITEKNNRFPAVMQYNSSSFIFFIARYLGEPEGDVYDAIIIEDFKFKEFIEAFDNDSTKSNEALTRSIIGKTYKPIKLD